MHRIEMKCKNCKFLKGNHTFWWCGSSLSKDYQSQIYPNDDNCEVFYPGTKRKSNNKKEKGKEK